MYLVTDAYKHGNERQIMSVFSAEQDVPGSATRKVTRKFGEANLFYMMADETSMRGRHGKLQPGFKFHTVEYLHTISSKDLDVPDKPRKVFQGCTRGDTIGLIKYDAFDKAVRTTFEAKKIYMETTPAGSAVLQHLRRRKRQSRARTRPSSHFSTTSIPRRFTASSFTRSPAAKDTGQRARAPINRID